MKTTLATLPPAHLLWLTTLVGGTVLVALILVISTPLEQLFGSSRNPFDDIIWVSAFVGLFATAFSLPTLLLLLFAMHWVFRTATMANRWVRLLLVVGASFGLAAGAGYYLLPISRMGAHFMACYLLAALLAATYIYRSWLFRS
jgi:hypothetical protein